MVWWFIIYAMDGFVSLSLIYSVRFFNWSVCSAYSEAVNVFLCLHCLFGCFNFLTIFFFLFFKWYVWFYIIYCVLFFSFSSSSLGVILCLILVNIFTIQGYVELFASESSCKISIILLDLCDLEGWNHVILMW
jgi:hypothetical protein